MINKRITVDPGELLRVACLNADGVVVHIAVVGSNSMVDWISAVKERQQKEWPGGLVTLKAEGPDLEISDGWRWSDGRWSPAKTPVEEQIDAVNASTAARFSAGFVFRGVGMSISQSAQLSANAIMQARDVLHYPVALASLDDTDVIHLESPAEVAEYCMALAKAVVGVRTEGVEMKQRLTKV